mgnify:CR=1 FL=1
MAKPKRPAKTLRKKKTVKVAPVTQKLDESASQSIGKSVISRRLFGRLRPATSAVSPMRVPGVWSITHKSMVVLWRHRWLFAGIVAVYTVLNLLLVRGLSGATDLTPLKELLSGDYPGGVGNIGTSLTLFAFLVSASGNNSSDVAGVYQTLLFAITSLATIWALRQVWANAQRVRIRDTFYKGMYPLIPVLLIVAVILLQMVPFVLGATIYSLVISNGIAVNAIERVLWVIPLLLGLLTSLYLMASSVVAVYIAALPDMTPMRALRSAHSLVRYRRWSVVRKLLFLPIALLVVSACIMLPVILVVTPAAPWIFFLLSMLGIVVIHSYLYTLYRELLE